MPSTPRLVWLCQLTLDSVFIHVWSLSERFFSLSKMSLRAIRIVESLAVYNLCRLIACYKLRRLELPDHTSINFRYHCVSCVDRRCIGNFHSKRHDHTPVVGSSCRTQRNPSRMPTPTTSRCTKVDKKWTRRS